MSSPWLGIGVVLAVLGTAACALRLYQRRCLPAPEHVRKLLHVTAGTLGLALPWMFETVWPVALLSCIVLAGLVIVRRSAELRCGIGSVIHGVGRRSLGELCFPLGVCAVFALAGGDHLRFAVPVLTLTLADPAAAVVGLRYGRHHYRIAGTERSVEGSIAFFVVAFACAAVPLAGAGGWPPSLAPIAAFALTLTAVEALAPHGLDNALIPIVGLLAFDGWLVGGPTWPALALHGSWLGME